MQKQMRAIIESQEVDRRWRSARRSPAGANGRGAARVVGSDTRTLPVSRLTQSTAASSRIWARVALPRPADQSAAIVRPIGRPTLARPPRRWLARAELPVSSLAVLAALPVAVVILSALGGVINTRELYARAVGVSLPAALPHDLVLETAQAPTGGDLPPLSIDASRYESIRRTEYTVVSGDTISGIAYRFGLHAGTILSLNPIEDVRRLLPGTVLSIPDRDGLFHAVQPGESLSTIAASHSVRIAAILDANDLETDVLQVGDSLFIPGARMDADRYLLAIGELFQWPVRNFRFTSGYGMRTDPIDGVWRFHNGIDLANVVGTPILASRAGRVVHVERQSGNYGNLIIIDHGDGFRTLYAHLDSMSVSAGQRVSAGAVIGRMGSTGRSTGPHLHFSIINQGRWEDPLRHLARR